jgi:hypothetical protein
MRCGTSAAFWKKYNGIQFAMAASCMPNTALVCAAKPMQIKTPLAFCALPGRIPANPVHVN